MRQNGWSWLLGPLSVGLFVVCFVSFFIAIWTDSQHWSSTGFLCLIAAVLLMLAATFPDL